MLNHPRNRILSKESLLRNSLDGELAVLQKKKKNTHKKQTKKKQENEVTISVKLYVYANKTSANHPQDATRTPYACFEICKK